jgi:hypothetical protein
MRAGFGHYVVVWLLFSQIASACRVDTSVGPQTQVVIDIDAEPEVRARSAQLQLSILGARDGDDALSGNPTFDRQFALGYDDAPTWPVRVVLVPKAGDSRRRFTVSATALDANDAFVTAVRLTSGYVAEEIRYANLVLEAACLDVQCPLGDSCTEGQCVSAEREPHELPLFWPTDDAGTPDASLDTDAADDDSGSPNDSSESPTQDAQDRCTRNWGGCDPLVTCQVAASDVHCGDCPSGYIDVHSDGTQCSDIDECARKNGGCDLAHGQCTNTPGGRECRCTGGYHGDGMRCTLNTLCHDASSCGKDAGCRDGICVCNAGYSGDGTQCDDIDECAQLTAACGGSATCTNTPGGFRCVCLPGYVDSEGTCVDRDECALNLDDCDDSPDACLNTAGGFQCVCPSGYTGDGKGASGCVDIDECTTNVDDCDDSPQACVNVMGTFMCMCPSGYTGNGKSSSGCADVDECATNNGGCDSKRPCTNEAGSFSCGKCDSGWSRDGATGCIDVDECTTDNGSCGKHRVCKNSAGSHKCGDCESGYYENDSGECVRKD